jgi:hypothetical protein
VSLAPHPWLFRYPSRDRAAQPGAGAADARREAAALAAMRGRAYAEWGMRHLLRTLNVAEVAQATPAR